MINIIEFFGNESATQYKKISLIHKKSISDGFLASLNLSILIQLYRVFAKSSHASLFIASDKKNNILGFIVLSFSTSKLYREFILKRFFIVLPLILPRIFSIKFIRKVIETLLYPFKKELTIDSEAEVLNFCVDKAHRGKGLGDKLFLKAEDSLRSRGIRSLKIVTGIDQIVAQKFYEKRGAILLGNQEIHKGSTSLIYQYNIITNTL